MVRCRCENIQHKNSECNTRPTQICDVCHYSFCGPCAKKHHAHVGKFSKL